MIWKWASGSPGDKLTVPVGVPGVPVKMGAELVPVRVSGVPVKAPTVVTTVVGPATVVMVMDEEPTLPAGV
jgi:hypothetical protein